MSYRATDRFENWFITSLQTGINDTTGSFRLNDNLNVQKGRLVIDPYDESVREVVKVTSVDGNLVYVERGDDNTQPHYHLEGAVVALNVVAADMNDLYADFAGVLDATADANTAAQNAQDAADNANAFNLSMGTVTQGTTSDASITGVYPNKKLNLTLAKGQDGTMTSVQAGTNVNVDSTDPANPVVSVTDAKIFLAAHPIGSTYWNETDSRNPGTVYGGTWVALQGVVLGGRSTTSGSPFNVAAGTIIGADTHTLTIAQMPSHSHSRQNGGEFVGVNSSSGGTQFGLPSGGYYNFRWGQTTELTYSGSGQAHNNIQRTLVGYLWKRTA